MNLRILATLAFVSLVAAACKTPGSSSVQDAAASGITCTFTSASAQHESLQVVGSLTSAASLNNVQTIYSPSDSQPGNPVSLANAPAVSADQITHSGARLLRTANKAPLAIDLSAFDCFALLDGSAGGNESYLCLAQTPNADGSAAALWAANFVNMKFAADLTTFFTDCTGS